MMQQTVIQGIRAGQSRRGVTMAGMLVLAALLATFCAAILERSTATYRTSAVLEWRLAACAAAEGVAVMLLADPARPPAPQVLGSATVTCHPPETAGASQALVALDVDVRTRNSDEIRHTAHYQALCVRDGAAWRLLRLEE